MTEQQIRNRFAKTAESYWGFREDDGSHKYIIDLYNSQEILPVNHKVTYTDPWCATFVSAMGILLGWSDIILPECSCTRMIELYKAAGRWEERDDYVPQIGDLVIYDWEDDGKGDNDDAPNHIGIVTACDGTKFTVIEGNKGNAVDYRKMEVDGKYIRGFCLPNFILKSEENYEMCEVKLPILKKGMKNNHVKALQTLLTLAGYNCSADGQFGPGTESSVKAFQAKKNIEVTGIVDAATWKALI